MKRTVILVLVVFIGFLWLNNTSLFIDKSGKYHFLAHRGLAQTFDVSAVEWDTNTAAIIYEPEHPYLENTIESMRVSFDYGAQAVELDIQLTKDKKLAVFHDFELSMRTNADGSIDDWNMADLKELDIGYGYTADNGLSYPFRGKGIGRMPELGEVLSEFPDKELLIHMKYGDLETAQALWSYLQDMPEERLKQIAVYGNETGLGYLRDQYAAMRVMSSERLKKALLKYELLGWTGYIPEDMKNMEIHIPIMYAKVLWGWPLRFVDRMESVNTRIVLVQGNGKWSEGFDTLESLDEIPVGYTGLVWTNRIDKVSQHI